MTLRPIAVEVPCARPLVSPPAEPWPVADLREFLSGSWSLERLIIDHARTTIGRFRGKAMYSPSGADLLYEETGTLIFGEHRGQATQTYRYNFPSGDGRALVRFGDGRPFHDLDLSNGLYRARHACPPDAYEGAFFALGPDRWRTEWKVTGPRKSYDLVTTYSRRPPRSA